MMVIDFVRSIHISALDGVSADTGDSLNTAAELTVVRRLWLIDVPLTEDKDIYTHPVLPWAYTGWVMALIHLNPCIGHLLLEQGLSLLWLGQGNVYL